METEIWKKIDWVQGYENIYSVSNYGRFRRDPREIIRKNGKSKRVILKEKILNQRLHKKKYYRVTLVNNKLKKHEKTHRLVAQAFIENTDNKPQINHKDLNKSNNHASNLEWCTNLENMYHAMINGVNVPKRKAKLYKIGPHMKKISPCK